MQQHFRDLFTIFSYKMTLIIKPYVSIHAYINAKYVLLNSVWEKI